MPATSPHAHTRDDILATADQALAAAAEQYLTLSDPDWKAAGSTNTAPPSDRRGTQVHAPLPVNVDVLDYLALAETELADLAGEVLGATGGHGDALGDGATDAPWTTEEAVTVIRDRLTHVPAEVAAEVAAVAWRLTRVGGRLLGTPAPGPARHRCPACGRRSVIPDPSTPGRVVCSSRACRATVTIAPDPSPAHE